MPAPVIDGLITFLKQNLAIEVWDGEVPRYDINGRAISPSAASTNPATWPVVTLKMTKSGFRRSWTFEDTYDDTGTIIIEVWSTARFEVEDLLQSMDAVFASGANWEVIPMGVGSANPNYVIKMLLKSWYSVQEEGVRTQLSELLYSGQLIFETSIHSSVPTS